MYFIKSNRLYFLFLIICITLGCFFFFQVVYDDAYIAFRYGYNWVYHGIWNFNPDARQFSEAYTTLTYALFSIIPAALDLNPYLFIKAVGFLILLLLVYRIFTYSTRLANKWLAVFFLLLNWQTYAHTFSGLETIFWVYLLFELIVETNFSKKHPNQFKIAVLSILLALTRPEGVLIVLFLYIYLFLFKKVKLDARILFVFFLIGIAYFIWRFQHFGLLLPLPFYQKTIKKSIGILNFILNIANSIHYILASLFFIIFVTKNKLLRGFGILLNVLFFLLYAVSFLAMNFADRFSFHLYIPFFIFCILETDLCQRKPAFRLKTALFILLSVVYAKGFFSAGFRNFSDIYENIFSGYYYSKTHLNLAHHFKSLNNPKIKVFFNEGGIYPYFSNTDYYDPEGLTYAPFCKSIITPTIIDSFNPDVFLYLVPGDEAYTKAHYHRVPDSHPTAYYKYLLTTDKYERLGYVECLKNKVYVGFAVNKESKHFEELCTIGNRAIQQAANDKFDFYKFIRFQYIQRFPKY